MTWITILCFLILLQSSVDNVPIPYVTGKAREAHAVKETLIMSTISTRVAFKLTPTRQPVNNGP